MLEYRKATSADLEAVRGLLERCDLISPHQTWDHFWIALDEGEVVGAAHVEVIGEVAFISNLGVTHERRGEGIAAALIDASLADVTVPVYLYTIIPEYFERLGFRVTDQHPALPPRAHFGCDNCEPNQCRCMVRNQ